METRQPSTDPTKVFFRVKGLIKRPNLGLFLHVLEIFDGLLRHDPHFKGGSLVEDRNLAGLLANYLSRYLLLIHVEGDRRLGQVQIAVDFNLEMNILIKIGDTVPSVR